MKKLKFLWDLHLEAWRDNWFIGSCMPLIYMCILTVIGLFGYLIFTFLDSTSQPSQWGDAFVTGKDFTPAHTSTIYIMVGKVMVPQTTHYDDAWELQLERNGETDWLEVSQEAHNGYNYGDHVKVVYQTGRFTGGFYVGSIQGLVTPPQETSKPLDAPAAKW